MTSVSPDLAKPVCLVKATSKTVCPICSGVCRVARRVEYDSVEWTGGCKHLRPFDFHRTGDGPLMAVFVTLPSSKTPDSL